MQILTSKLLSTKLGAIIGTWVRMDTNTTRECDLIHAVEERILELSFLGYKPKHIMRSFMHMHNKTGNQIWKDFTRRLGGNPKEKV